MTRTLETEPVACPGCGDWQKKPFLEAPAQLVDLDQSFSFAQCTECDLVYLDQRVIAEQTAALYEADYPLHRGPALWGPFAPLVERDLAGLDARRVALVRQHVTLGEQDAALDLGCGRPTFLAALREATGCRAFGVDVMKPSDEPRFAGIDVFEAMPPAWPLELERAAPFTVATLWHYLEHDPDPLATLRWLRERVCPGGAVVVEVPDLDGSTARLLGRYWPGFHTPRHASVFTTRTLSATAERAGWRVVAHTRTGTLSPFVLLALGALDRCGFRFGSHSAPLVFPLWTAAMVATWPWLGPATRRGQGLQTIVLA